MELKDIQEKQSQFIKEREWEKFHSIGNLCKAISVEAGELLEISIWKPFNNISEISEKEKNQLKEEIADIFLYSLSLCKVLEIDPIKAMQEKIFKNEKKYPKEFFRGRVSLE
jgi:dCTP diphosphatase